MNAGSPSASSRTASLHAHVWLLVCSLLLASTLGLMHRAVHAAGSGVWAAVADTHEAHSPTDAPTPWVQQLFAAHGKASDCRLFDQLNQADTLLPAAVACPQALLLPRLPLAQPVWAFSKREDAPFHARAPPRRWAH